MKTFFIKIDLSTIKENENWGQTETRIPTHKTITFQTNKLPDFFMDGINCLINSCDVTDGICHNFQGEIIDAVLLEKCIEEKIENLNITVSQNYRTITHWPIPRYAFSYRNTKIKCDNCGKNIMSNNLKTDVSEDNECYSNRICPECGEFDCCSLLYETIEEALKRKK